MALPLLEGLAPREATAADDVVPPFAIFLRQANGVASGFGNSPLGEEPDRFWPTQLGPLTESNMAGQAVDELADHAHRLLIVDNVDTIDFDYADGHARGALQALTARGPVVPGAGLASEAAGESIDHRIGRELNEGGRESMFLYAGNRRGVLGGACISYRGPGNRRAPLHDPVNAYQAMMGLENGQFAELAARQESVNGIVREQMRSLLARSELGVEDRRRLDLHMTSIRDLETNLSCSLKEDEEARLAGEGAGYEARDGNRLLAAARTHMDIAALAVACGYTRSVTLQIGNGTAGFIRFWDPTTGIQMENSHNVSHRLLAPGESGEVIANGVHLHHQIDRQHGQLFKYLLDRLAEYEMPNGQKLVDCGVSVWLNDLGNGPGHSFRRIPYILAGSAGGFLKQGQYVEAVSAGAGNHAKMLNTIGSAAGVRKNNGDFLTDFGDPASPKGVMDELLA